MDQQSANQILWCLPIVVCVGVLFFYKKTIGRANAILQNWARQNDFEIVHFERCFFAGAFSWLTTSANQVVYFVRVRDREHHERSGWVRCGSWSGFIFCSNQTEVKWDESH